MYHQSIGQAGTGGAGAGSAAGLWHAAWFAKKGPGPSWRMQFQPTRVPVSGQQIWEACAGMLFLSGALEQEQWGFQASDAKMLPLPSVSLLCQVSPCPGHHAIRQAGTDQGSWRAGGSSAPWAQGATEPMGWDQGWTRGLG